MKYVIIFAFLCIQNSLSSAMDQALLEISCQKPKSDFIETGALGANALEKSSSKKEYSLFYGISARQGLRRDMEDYAGYVNNDSRHVFMVYDGHGGAGAAAYARQNLVQEIFYHSQQAPQESLQTVIVKSFSGVDAQICKATNSGTTVSIAYISDNKLTLAWVGDSRCILIRDGALIYETLDHNGDCETEFQRVTKEGGYFFKNRLIGGTHGDLLAITRALGDKSFKGRGLSCEPDIHECTLQQGDMIIMASDGVWGFCDSEFVANVVATFNRSIEAGDERSGLWVQKYSATPKKDEICYEEGDERMKLLARVIRDKAFQNGSSDNIAVLAIQFN